MHIPTHVVLALAATAVCSSLAAQIAQAPCYETNLGTNIGAGDDTVLQGQALGFTFPGPAGPVTSIDISSNGFVWLASNNDPACCDGDETFFLTGMPRIAACWMDLYPPGGNGVFFNSIPGSGSTPSRAVITWDCPEFGTSGPSILVQLQLLSDGSIVISQGPGMTVQYHSPLVGITQGNNATPNLVDFSTLSGAPLNTGTNPTVYDWMQLDPVTGLPTYDLGGHSYEFIPNGQNGYLAFERTTCRYAAFSTYGAGCPQPPTFYELFPLGGNPLDLSNVALQFIPNGTGGYTALPSPNGIWPGFTNNLLMGDDDVQGPFTLPFPFVHAGGFTSAIDICSNGCVFLNAGVNLNSRCCNGDPVTFLAEDASIAGLWMDLYPPGATSGGVFFDVDVPNQVAYITWSNVPEFFNTGANTFQIALYASGIWELRYGAVSNSGGHDVLVGYTLGNGSPDPGPIDLSATPWTTGAAGTPLTLAATSGSAPRINGPFSMDVSGIPAASPIGFMLLSFGRAALDLAPLGAPGCFAHVNVANSVANVFPASGGQGLYGFTIPNLTGLIGLNVYAQAAALSSINALGVITSNGGKLELGR